MTKSKKPKSEIVKFLREIVAIVIGVAITLSASYFITKSNEKRDMHLYLNAIKMELEKNLTDMEEAVEYYRLDVKYAKYLRSTDRKMINKDSLKSYNDTYFTIKEHSFKVNAFEMFKFSGTMRLMKNKELMLAIWDVYDDLTSLKDQSEWLSKAKFEDFRNEISKIVENDFELTEIPMYNYYISGMPDSGLAPYENVINTSKELLSELEKELKIKKIPENESLIPEKNE